MKNKLKQALFVSYEKEMHFRNDSTRAKEGLTFASEKKPAHLRHMIPSFAALMICTLAVVSGHFAVNAILGENNKSSSSESVSNQEKTNASLPLIDGIVPGEPAEMTDGSITFHPFEGCILTFAFIQEDNILSIESSVGIDAGALTVSDYEEVLLYEESLRGYRLKEKDEHTISWKYIEGEEISENQFRIVR